MTIRYSGSNWHIHAGETRSCCARPPSGKPKRGEMQSWMRVKRRSRGFGRRVDGLDEWTICIIFILAFGPIFFLCWGPFFSIRRVDFTATGISRY